MISVLAQERLLGAALGSLLTGGVVFEQRRNIYKSISHYEPQILSIYDDLAFKMQSMTNHICKPTEPIFGRKSRQEFAHMWNKSVDNTFGAMIEYLSSRGW